MANKFERDLQNANLDGAFTANKRIIEQIGYIKGKIEIMNQCLNDIRNITEHDIWYPAWERVSIGLSYMQRLIDKGCIR